MRAFEGDAASRERARAKSMRKTAEQDAPDASAIAEVGGLARLPLLLGPARGLLLRLLRGAALLEGGRRRAVSLRHGRRVYIGRLEIDEIRIARGCEQRLAA
eukprot:1527178-Pleurochrysis_carterae.AAC.6